MSFKQKSKQFLSNSLNEKCIFFLFTIASLIPFCLTYYVGSLDGPKHLQVANMVNEIWKGNSLYENYYLFNPLYIGNVLGNYIIAFFHIFLPAWLSEKLFLIIYLISFVTGFRYLIISINGKSDYITLLIFPFASTSLFMLGYYNFSMATGLMFFSLGYYIRHYKSMKVIHILIMILLVLLTYYSHIFIFGFLLLILGLFISFQTINDLFQKKPKAIVLFLKRTMTLSLFALPGMILAFFYPKLILTIPAEPNETMLFPEKLAYITKLKMLIGFDREPEMTYTGSLFILVIVLIVWAIVNRIIVYYRYKHNSSNLKTSLVNNSDFWLVLSIIISLFYFLAPNNSNGAGNISIRISIILIYSIIIWVSLQQFQRILLLLPILAIAFILVSIKTLHVGFLKELDKTIVNIKQIESRLPDNSVIFTQNYSNNWIDNHFRSYIGTDKPIIDLHNPSCSKLFILEWNYNKMPYSYVGGRDLGSITQIYNNPRTQDVKVADYIIVLGYAQSDILNMDSKVKRIIDRDYILTYVSKDKFIGLYKFSADEKIEKIEHDILLDSEKTLFLKCKAKDYGIPFESLVKRKAIWIYDQAFKID